MARLKEGNWMKRERMNISLNGLSRRILRDLMADTEETASAIINRCLLEKYESRFGTGVRPDITDSPRQLKGV
jgi:hypothetical protein